MIRKNNWNKCESSRDNFAKPHTLSLAYKATTFFDHGDLYMNIFKYMKNIKWIWHYHSCIQGLKHFR